MNSADVFTAKIDGKKKVIGLNQVLRGLENKTVKAVILASDADKAVTDKVAEKARRAGVPVHTFPDKVGLGGRCGIDVPCAAVGLTE